MAVKEKKFVKELQLLEIIMVYHIFLQILKKNLRMDVAMLWLKIDYGKLIYIEDKDMEVFMNLA